MAATAPQTLFAEASCFCPLTAQAYQTMKLALLSQALTTLGVTMTLSELMDYGKCFGCLGLTPSEQVELALLDLISANISGGGGGGGGNDGGVVDPEGVVSGSQWQFYTNTSTMNVWQKITPGVGNTGWQLFI